MEFELPKINVRFEYDEEKDEIVFVINGVEKRVKTADMITEMEKLQEQNTALEQEPCEDCISRKEVCNYIAEFVNHEYATDREHEMVEHIIGGIQHLPSVQPKAESEDKE